jgi:uncharacterized protein (TIGR02118 family)
MVTVVVLFNLKAGVNAAEYEAWARSTDLPTVRKLSSVKDFRVVRAQGLLGSDAKPPYQYVELLELTSLEALGQDVNNPTMQKVVAEFANFADNPQFIITEHI